jgi:hypothetical protein
VDAFDYLASAGIAAILPPRIRRLFVGGLRRGRLLLRRQVITIAGTSGGSDTDGWSDMVILHERALGIGHVRERSQYRRAALHRRLQPGPPTLLWRGLQPSSPPRSASSGPRGNDLAAVDNHVSIYADLAVPPALPGTGSLEFSYDVETGLFRNTGVPIGQIGSACETNDLGDVGSRGRCALTRRREPSDEQGNETGSASWAVIRAA